MMDESDDSYDPILPDDLVVPAKSSAPPPVPRLWKTPPEPEEVAEFEATKAKKPKEESAPVVKARPKPKPKPKKKEEPAIDDGTGAVKLEATPVLDTYESRQRARWLFGGLIGVIGIVFVSIIYQAVKGSGSEEIREGEPPDLRAPASETRVVTDSEVEARNMLENAKQADKLGRTSAALTLVNRLIKTYPNSSATREGKEAIDRYRQNQPLFGEDSTQQATGPGKPPQTVVASAGNPNPAATPPPADASKAAPPKPPTPPKEVVTAIPTPAPAPIAINPMPRGYRPNYDAPIHASGWPTRILSDQDGGELVLVIGGTFDQGRQDGNDNERPVHRVTLSTYYIDLHEVTVRQYSTFLRSSGRPLEAVKKITNQDLPMVSVSSQEAKAFCEWAGRKLPTEAQWEMAARSTDGRISFWNGELPRKDPVKGTRPMEPVMSLPSDVSPYGVFDLAANAWEWTGDFYESRYYDQLRDPVTDPPGPKKRSGLATMTVKGGSKSGFLTWREGLKAESRYPYLGFRGALQVETTVAATPNRNNTTATPPPSATPPSSGGVQPF